jgi:hypothetical protein
VEPFLFGDNMQTLSLQPTTTLPPLDGGSILWLTKVKTATMQSQTCMVPQKYFDVLYTRGLVQGTAMSATVTGDGMTQALQAEAENKKTSGKSKKK